MPTKAFSQAKLLGTDNTISVTSLSADIPITEKLATVDDLPSTGVIGEQAFVEETNRLYIWNGTGWYNIALINTTPTWVSGGQPAGAYELSADSPQTATTITLAASDPEGLSIDYSYVTSGSMDSMATISQDSSVFTITPKTLAQMGGAGNEGPHTGSITFRATDGVNVLPQVSSFTLSFIFIIDDSKYTIMHVNAIAASDNNNITDSSTNSHTITVNGDAHAGTFSPYRSGGYSTFFGRTRLNNPSGDPTEAITATLGSQIGTGDFSFSYWVYVEDPSTGPNPKRHFDLGGSGVRFYQHSNGTMRLQIGGGTVLDYAALGTLSIKSWHYVSVTRSSGTVAVHFDGILAGSTTNSTDITQTNFRVGAGTTNDITFGLIGYVRDFMVKNVAVYSVTENYTVPISAAESDSDTLILLCSLPYHTDASSNNLTLDLYPVHNGVAMSVAPEIHAFSPYDYVEYSAADNGGSVYFDGSGDKLTVGGSASDFNFGTNSFTIEGWMYSQVAAVGTLFNTHRVGVTSGYYLSWVANNAINWGNYVDGTGDVTTGAGAFAQNTWNHISVNRDASSSNSLKIYVNGVLKYTGTSATNYNTFSYGPHVGGYDPGGAQYDFTGYLSDIVVVNGSVLRTGGTSVGDVAFTPPTTPIATPSNTKLHIKGTDASIIDTAQSTHVRCVGSAAGTSSPVKFPGTHSLSLPGFGHWMPSPMNNGVRLSGTEDWTVEAWVYPTSRQSYSVVVSCGSSFALALGMVSGNFHVYNNSAGGFTDTDVNYGTYDIPANQWTHLAATRVSGNWYCYVDGTLRYQKTGGSWQSHVMNETTQYTIGALDGYSSFSGNERWYGNIQDVRITKGLARYTSNFTPPTAPLEG